MENLAPELTPEEEEQLTYEIRQEEGHQAIEADNINDDEWAVHKKDTRFLGQLTDLERKDT